MRRFGFECEVASGATATLAILCGEGLAPEEALHVYHCECSDCQYDSQWTFRGQEDCTADGEIITSILHYGTHDADRAFTGLACALMRARATTSTGQGFHVHVDRSDLDAAAQARVYRLFLRYQDELAELAATRHDAVRSYNCSLNDTYWPDGDEIARFAGRGQWLHHAHRGTFEFRLWNATRVEWRMRLAVGVSVALVQAAADGADVTRNDPRPLEETLAPWLDEPTWAGILRQRYSKGGMAA